MAEITFTKPPPENLLNAIRSAASNKKITIIQSDTQIRINTRSESLTAREISDIQAQVEAHGYHTPADTTQRKSELDTLKQKIRDKTITITELVRYLELRDNA